MKQQRVTTDELLELREHVDRLHKRSRHLSQISVSARLDMLYQYIDDAAKSTAYDEVVARRSLAAEPKSPDEKGNPST